MFLVAATFGAAPAMLELLGTEVTVTYNLIGDYSFTLGPQSFLVGTQNLKLSPLSGQRGTLCDPEITRFLSYSMAFTNTKIQFRERDRCFWWDYFFRMGVHSGSGSSHYGGGIYFFRIQRSTGRYL